MYPHAESPAEDPRATPLPEARAAQPGPYGLDGRLDARSVSRSRVERRLRRQSSMYGRDAAKQYLARLAELDEALMDREEFYDLADAALSLTPGTARSLIERIETG